ncbi:MAG: T9SS type A sorting domain-containing protein [Bacteroidetes bacterium]|nr:T9SS type A sorting domain-containing protein [Bacteroidota bacterium]
MYPNPSSFVIFIGNFVNIITSIEIYNLTGQLLSKQVGYDEQNGIDIENLPPSLIYILPKFPRSICIIQ